MRGATRISVGSVTRQRAHGFTRIYTVAAQSFSSPQITRPKIMKFTRRQFLGTSATAVIVAGMKAQGSVIGANSRIRLCTIGFHGQGGTHIRDILGMKTDAEYVALCDVDANVRAKGAATVKAAQGKEPKLYKDMRDVFA